MSPGLIFSIATKPLVVRTSVPATKHFIVVVISPVNTAVAVTPVWKMLYVLLSCNLAFNVAISPFPKALSTSAIVSNSPMAVLITFVTDAVPLINLPKPDIHLIPLPATAPNCPSPAKAAPPIAPLIAPESAPSSKPSRNEPPLATLSNPPDTPPIQAPKIAPQQAPAIISAPKPEPTPVQSKTTATATRTTVAINFQCSLHQSAADCTPSHICSIGLFSHSGFK